MRRNKERPQSGVAFAADAPISSSAEDVLGRAVFSASLARALSKSSPDQSIVVAVNGGWGTGKSSVKNMAVEYLKKHRLTEIIEFNPWEFSGAADLTEAFFHDLGLALGVQNPGEEEIERVAAWNALAKRLGAGASTVKAAGKVLGFLGVPMAETIGSAVSGVLEKGGELSQQAKDVLEEETKLEKKTLSELKEEVRSKLPTLGKPLVVIVDDIDRLAADEVCVLFRMVKANANFPGVAFLLLFDRPQVVRALGQIATGHGEAFLEKIVQVSFDVPDLTRTEIDDIAQTEFNELLRKTRVTLEQVERTRWNGVYAQAIGQYFTTLRIVRRYMNSLSFHFSLFQTGAGFELNAVDLAILEILRVFENDLYRQLPRRRALLLAEPPYWPGLDHQLEEATGDWTQLLAIIPPERRTLGERILHGLFPNAAPHQKSGGDEITIASRRVSHPRMFDAYFHLSMSTQIISQAELVRIRRASSAYPRFVAVLRQYSREGRFDILMDHLWGYVEAFYPHALAVTQAFFDVSDGPFEAPSGWVKDSEGYVVTNFVQDIIRNSTVLGKRADLVIGAIRKAKGLHLPFLVVSGETNYRHEKDASDLLIPEDRLAEAKAALLGRLEMTPDTALLTRPNFLPWKLQMWRDWGGTDKPAQWVEKQLSGKNTLIRLLKAFSDSSRTTDGSFALRGDLLSEFAELPVLQRRVADSIQNGKSHEIEFLKNCLEVLDDLYFKRNPIP